jgi:hypothetical protein
MMWFDGTDVFAAVVVVDGVVAVVLVPFDGVVVVVACGGEVVVLGVSAAKAMGIEAARITAKAAVIVVLDTNFPP